MQLEAVEGFLSGEANRYDLYLKMITLAPLEKVNRRRQRWVLGNPPKAITVVHVRKFVVRTQVWGVGRLKTCFGVRVSKIE